MRDETTTMTTTTQSAQGWVGVGSLALPPSWSPEAVYRFWLRVDTPNSLSWQCPPSNVTLKLTLPHADQQYCISCSTSRMPLWSPQEWSIPHLHRSRDLDMQKAHTFLYQPPSTISTALWGLVLSFVRDGTHRNFS